MKKKRRSTRWKVTNLFLAFQVAIVLVFSGGHVYGMVDEPLLNLSLKNVAVKDALWEIEKQSKMVFVYNADDLGKAGKISMEIKGKTVREALDICLKDSGFEYVIQQNTVVIKRKAVPVTGVQMQTITGKVVGQDSVPLPGVTILLKGTSSGVVTDLNGKYTINIPVTGDPVLLFTFIGMKKEEINVAGKKVINVVLKEELTTVDEVVVTGIYSRKKESFTGSSETYTTKELKMVGNKNILESLRTLDPAFNIIENNQYGSDPNRLPDIEIRGKSSIVGFKEQFGQDPNQPLFILDGFETTLATIMDLSLDRVASVTILKDAASTAIYGSKAANGVVVVETKSPERGRLRLSYN
ncbi:carboxypeptidase-like regulatory domain-containing protein [Butyricimonas virosa]|uniref:STN domain-containing protein n=1 Tax=Butyricimonas virosa TaxID=544645 RepID=UPI003D07DC1C